MIQLAKDNKAIIKAYGMKYETLKREGGIVENDIRESTKVQKHITRAKDDYLLANGIKITAENPKIKTQLKLPSDFDNLYHWLIIISYYSMYHAATAAIAKKKIKCDSHVATITSLAKHYLEDEELEFKFLKTLEYVYINYIESGRESRKGAQYNVDEEYTKEEAFEVFENAGKFVKKISEIL